jgi:transposase InsO family protein
MNTTPFRNEKSSHIKGCDRKNIALAAENFRKVDGEFLRFGIRELAKVNGISERTVRRIIQGEQIQPKVKHPMQVVHDQIDNFPQYGEEPEQVVLQCLAHCMGIATAAHALAQASCGYPKGYKSFLREMECLHPVLVAHAKGGRKAAIRAGVYLANVSSHRNERWHIDSTMADVRVRDVRKATPIRPYLTVVTEAATGMIMSIFVSKNAPNSTSTSLAIAMAAGSHDPNNLDSFVGGLPTTIVFDNGSENINDAVIEGCMRLGLQALPTAPRSPWLNGPVERAHKHIRDLLLGQLPGSMSGGVNSKNESQFAPRWDARQSATDGLFDGHNLLTFDAFAFLLEQFRLYYNAHERSSGYSPLEKWEMDTTPIRLIDADMVLTLMAKEDRPRTVGNSGIKFRKRKYHSAELSKYRFKEVSVRFFPHIPEWIEVFDGHNYIGRAFDTSKMPTEERNEVPIERNRVNKKAEQIYKAVAQRRNHEAALINEQCDAESQTETAVRIQNDPDVELAPTTPNVNTRKKKAPTKSGKQLIENHSNKYYGEIPEEKSA